MEQINHSRIPFFSDLSGFQTLLFLLGLIFFMKKFYRVAKIIYVAFIRPERNFPSRYGEGSYAVITGAADGIGEAFCFSLAQRGINIVLLDRNNSKLELVNKHLKAEYPSIKTKVISVDFMDSTNEKFFSHIMSQLNDIDVSILVNNVGIEHGNYFAKLSEAQLKELIIVNCIPQPVFSKFFIKRFLLRKDRSCIIDLSSFSVTFPTVILQTYASTKSFNDYFSRSVALECPEIDVLVVRPGYVDTLMNKGKPNKVCEISAQQCVEGTLKEVGYESETFGHWKHKLLWEVADLAPDWIKNLSAKSIYTSDGKKNKKSI